MSLPVHQPTYLGCCRWGGWLCTKSIHYLWGEGGGGAQHMDSDSYSEDQDQRLISLIMSPHTRVRSP